jgi:outer membrane protein assembly factor BamD (BamD/ComL family)
MTGMTKLLAASITGVLLLAAGVSGTETLRLGADGDWQPASGADEQYRLAVAELKRYVDAGETKKAEAAAEQLKMDFPDVAGEDFDLFVKAELLLSKGKLSKAAAAYEQMLNNYPASGLRDAAVARQFEIAAAFLEGRRKRILGLFLIRNYTEGIKIMEKITDRMGTAEISKKGALAVATHYEAREKWDEAYLKWNEISSLWPLGETGKRALRGMAESKYAAYRGPDYDASSLISAKSYYKNYEARYPGDAAELHVDAILAEIDDKLAAKDLSTAMYYQSTGNRSSANLYFEMVINKWPGSNAAMFAAEQMNLSEPEVTKVPGWLSFLEKFAL